MVSLLGGVFLGWSLGANDAANVFGPAVYSRMVRFWTAAVLAAVFVVIGAVWAGQGGIDTLQGLTRLNGYQAVLSAVGAALAVAVMTLLGLPVSTSQAVVGAILGIGILNRQLNVAGLEKVVACWIGTPIGAAIVCIAVYHLCAVSYNRLWLNLFTTDRLLRIAMVVAGVFGAFALGANNVANVTAVYVGAGLLTPTTAKWVGGLSIALGIVTFSRPVMRTVGRKLVPLDPFSGLMVVISLGVTVQCFTFLGVPVSTSQGVVGAVMGIGLMRGMRTVDRKTIAHILMGWTLTPALACTLVLLLHFLMHLRYVPG